MNAENDIALVEKYFDDELNAAEMQHFTERMQSDESFKILVEQEKALITAIRFQGMTDDLQYLRKLESTLDASKVVPLHAPSTKKWYFAAAAAIALIVVLAKVFIAPAPSSEELFQAYYKPYPNLFEPTVRGDVKATKRTEAFQAYEQGDYKKASLMFRELLKEKEESGILLLLGNCNLILGNVEEAKQNFTTLNSDFDELDIQAKWFLGLCYLKSGDVERAKTMLTELGQTEISYANKAKELLEKLN